MGGCRLLADPVVRRTAVPKNLLARLPLHFKGLTRSNLLQVTSDHLLEALHSRGVVGFNAHLEPILQHLQRARSIGEFDASVILFALDADAMREVVA